MRQERPGFPLSTGEQKFGLDLGQHRVASSVAVGQNSVAGVWGNLQESDKVQPAEQLKLFRKLE